MSRPSHTHLIRDHKMIPLKASWYFWVLFLLLIVEFGLSVLYHTPLSNVLLANTLMLLIVMINHSYSYEDNAIGLLYRICGLVVYCAMLFLNLTHSLEEITNINEDHSMTDHSHEHNETAAGHHLHLNGSEFEVPVDDHSHTLTDFEYRIYVYVAIADLLIRVGLASFSKLPTLKLHWAKAAILYSLTPLTIIASYGYRRFLPTEYVPKYINEQLEPLSSAILCLIYYAIIWKAFIALKPYLFAETPKIFSKEELEADIKQKFPYVISCPHVHAFCIWPGKYFEVMISMNMKINMKEDDWELETVNRFEDVRRYVHDKLEREGAQRVIIEPCFLDENEPYKAFRGCVDEECYKQNLGCCKLDLEMLVRRYTE